MIRSIVFLLLTPALFGISKEFTQGKDSNLVNSKELNEYEKVLDKQIQDLNKQIEAYIVILKKLDIKRTPIKIIYHQNEDHIALISYLEDTRHYFLKEMKLKTFRVYFQGNTFSKFHLIVADHTYTPPAVMTDIVLDTDPNKLDKSKVEIVSKFFDSLNRIEAQDIENSVVYPLRIRMKKDFYVPTLQFLLTNLQLIREYHLNELKDQEKEALLRFQRSKRF